MKNQLLLLLVGIAIPTLGFAKLLKTKQPRDDIEPEEDDDDSPLDLEREVFGPEVEKLEGFHVLDEDLNVIISEPSERVLRAIVNPDGKKNALTLEKVRAMYHDKMEKQKRENLIKLGYSDKDFETMLAEEQKIEDKNAESDGTILKRIMDYIW